MWKDQMAQRMWGRPFTQGPQSKVYIKQRWHHIHGVKNIKNPTNQLPGEQERRGKTKSDSTFFTMLMLLLTACIIESGRENKRNMAKGSHLDDYSSL